jgi:DNA repair protein RecO (recombination protein O)
MPNRAILANEWNFSRGLISMDAKKITGIILKSIPFQDDDWIITAFTKQIGLVSFISKGKFKKNIHLNYNLCLCELTLASTKTHLYRLVEFKLLDEHLFLRQSFTFLKTAQLMAKAILQTQLFLKEASSLFYLLQKCIQWIPQCTDCDHLFTLFLLKVLKFEGGFYPSLTCTICKDQVKTIFILNGESRCHTHKEGSDMQFDDQEVSLIEHILKEKDKEKLLVIELPQTMCQAIKTLFSQLTKRGSYAKQ